MNQKEEIGKLEDELTKKEVALKQLKTKLNEKYGDTVQAIDEAKMKMTSLRTNKQDMLMQKVKIFSDKPTRYISYNESRRINSDIASRIRQIEGETEQNIFSKSTEYIWREIYHEIIRKSPEIKMLDKKIEDIEERLWKNVPEGYLELEKNIDDITRRVSWLEQRIVKLSDIGYFRQWAKQRKEMEMDKITQIEEEKALEKFKAYFNKEYLPKITED